MNPLLHHSFYVVQEVFLFFKKKRYQLTDQLMVAPLFLVYFVGQRCHGNVGAESGSPVYLYALLLSALILLTLITSGLVTVPRRELLLIAAFQAL